LRQLILFFSLIMSIFQSFSQGEANIWYIQGSNGIDFNSGAPLIRSGFVPCASDRGGQSISDKNGHLLFYTDSYTIYDRNSQRMPNGSGILGGGWQMIVVQEPGSSSIYYLFYIQIDRSGISNGNILYYSTIDMSLHGGMGDVTSSKNIILISGVNQRLGTTIHRNGSDIWVNGHGYQGNTFYSFLLSGTGVSVTPVINNIGHYYDSVWIATPGQVRSSPNGNILVMANPVDTSQADGSTTSSIEFFSFDNSTAQMNNPIFIRGFYNAAAYGLTGVEFSPNGHFVYACNSSVDSISYYQYSVCNFSQQAVATSQTQLASIYSRTFNVYDLQLAPDNKIYSINYPLSTLNVIEKPDFSGLACTFTQNAFSTGNFNGFTLPYFSNAIIHALSKGRFSAINTCIGQPTLFGLNETVDSVKWNFGEISSGLADSSTSLNPSHTYQIPGTYTINAILFTSCSSDTLSKNITILSPGAQFLGPDTILCANQVLTLYANIPGSSFSWQDNSTSNSFTVNSSGKYWVTVGQSGCILSDTIMVTYQAIPTIFLGNDTTLCIGSSVILDAQGSGINYLWDNGSMSQKRIVDSTGAYWVTVSSNGCSASDTIVCKFVPGPSVSLGDDTTLCQDQTLILNSGNHLDNTTYLWNSNSTEDSLVVSQPGLYWVKATRSGCSTIDTVDVAYHPKPNLFLGNDTAICTGASLLLQAGQEAGDQYLWQDGSNAPDYDVTLPGNYSLKVSNQFNCSSIDSIHISFKPIPIFRIGKDTSLCEGQTLLLQVPLNNLTYLWSTGNTSYSLPVNASGLYWLKESDSGCAKTDSITVNFKPSPTIHLGNDTTLCIGNSITLTALNNNATYLWQDGSDQPTFIVNQAGIYNVRIDIDGCDTTGTIAVAYSSKPAINWGPRDTSICNSEELLLNAYNPQSTYEWQDGSMQSEFRVTKEGQYTVQVQNICGVASDTISVKYASCSCRFSIPNAFTPNNDGKNDVFRPNYSCLFSDYELQIFNRWGQMIFVSQNAGQGWDGTFERRMQPVGTYVWMISYMDTLAGKMIKKTGTITLIR